MQVTEKLHARADKKEPEKAGFEDLADRVEEFTLRFMDPLKYDSDQRKAFSENSGTQVILETAIKLKQKKVIKIFKPLMLVAYSSCPRSAHFLL